MTYFRINDRVKIMNYKEFQGLTGTVVRFINDFIIEVLLDEPVKMSWDTVIYVRCTRNQLIKITPNWETSKLKNAINSVYGKGKFIPGIKNVYFNDSLTIVIWEDGTKTFVKNADGDDYYDPEKALAMAISKKALGNKYNYYKEFKKWLPEADEEASIEEFNKALSALAAISAMLPKSKESSNPVEKAYRILMEVNNNPTSTEADFAVAIEAAIGYLGEALSD